MWAVDFRHRVTEDVRAKRKLYGKKWSRYSQHDNLHDANGTADYLLHVNPELSVRVEHVRKDYANQ